MTATTNPEVSSAPWRRIVLWAGVPLAIGALNEFALLVALPAIRADFGLGVDEARWLLLAFLIADALTLIPAGRYGDRVGRRRTASIGLAVIAAASLGCALAPDSSFGLLLALRVLEGIGAGLLFSGLLAIIAESVPRDSIGRAFGLWAVLGAIAVLASPVVGGALAEHSSWRWIFGLNAALSLAALLAAGRVIPALEPTADAERPKAGLAGVPNYAVGTGVMAGIYLAVALTWLPLVFLLSLVSEKSPTEVGLMFLAYSVWWLALPPFTGRLADRVGARTPMVAGLLLSAVGLAVLTMASDGSSLGMICGGLSLMAIGISFSVPATNAATMGQVPAESRGAASGVNMTARIVGSCAGLLVSGFLIGAGEIDGLDDAAGWSWGIAAATLVALALLAAVGVKGKPESR